MVGDLVDNNKYVEEFVKKLKIKAEKKPELNAVVKVGERISKETDFVDLDL
mgnify:CR=1 FL=1